MRGNMTREEQAIEHIKKYRELDEKLYNTAPKGTVSSIATKKCLEFWDMAISAFKQQPCDDIAQERYKDLCEYFGGAKDILKNREDFKAWLGRVKWHIRKAEELYEKYEYKKEPCDDAVSRQAVIDVVFESRKNFNNDFDQGFLQTK